jgi:predicted TPR repeat methyltransferase
MRFLHDPVIDWRATVKQINPALAHLPPAVSTAQTLAVYGKTAEAEQLYQELLADAVPHPKTRRAYAELLQRLGRNQEASEQRRLAIDAEVAAMGLAETDAVHTAAFRQAVEGLGVAPAVAPRAYVAQRFDEYADHFEQHLTDTLNYQTPQLLVEAITQTLPKPLSWGIVFDGGCGTGLMGPLLRLRSGRMIGCDLSARMIEQARQKSVYDELHVGDVSEILLRYCGDIDLVVIADVFPYIGDLREIMQRVHRSLRPGGWLAFSAERYEGAEYHLHPQGRYAHAESYLRGLAEEMSFTLCHHTVAVLREQLDTPVYGHIMVWQA